MRLSEPPPPTLDTALLEGLSTYQDIVLAGKTVARGARDCPGRWALIEPHLPPLGTVLDVGSNFGWFGLQACEHAPRAVVASCEADARSAAVQRQVLASHATRRIALATRPAGARLARRFARQGQRFDAVFCLAVLHWMRDHRRFLETLAPISGRMFLELPPADEAGAGIERVRRELSPPADYLRSVFPRRTIRRLAELTSHRDERACRELWLVEEPAGWPDEPSAGVSAEALLALAPSWPPRSWWQAELANAEASAPRGPMLFTADGLEACETSRRGASLASLRRRLQRVPEHEVFTPRERFRRRTRSCISRAIHWARSLAK